VRRHNNLMKVADATRASRGVARRADGRQQQSDQNSNDRNHDQQLDQRKRSTSLIFARVHGDSG
jgi:hypothetical protein